MKAHHILAVAISGTCATAGASETADYVRDQTLSVRSHMESSISLGGDMERLREALLTVFVEAQEPGWDGYEAEAMSLEAFSAASEFIECLPLTMELPTVTAEPDGQVSFEWYRSPEKLLSVSVSPGRELHFASTIGRESDYGTRVLCGSVPKRITDLIADVCTA